MLPLFLSLSLPFPFSLKSINISSDEDLKKCLTFPCMFSFEFQLMYTHFVRAIMTYCSEKLSLLHIVQLNVNVSPTLSTLALSL